MLTGIRNKIIMTCLIIALLTSKGASAQTNNLLTGLISWWGLNETNCSILSCTTGPAADSHSNNNLTANNTPFSIAGVYGSGYDFRANASEYLSVADNGPLSAGTTGFTMSLWINPDVLGGTVASKNDGTDGWLLRLQADGSIQFAIFQNGIERKATSPPALISVGSWHLVVFGIDGISNAFLRVDTNEVATLSSFPLIESGAPLIFATNNNLNNFYDGQIDEIAYWGKPLAANELLELENSGSGRNYISLFINTGGGGNSGPEAGTYTTDLYSGRQLVLELRVTAGEALTIWLLLMVVTFQIFPILRDSSIASAARKRKD